MEVILIKDVAEVMSLDAEQVDNLPKSCIYFLLRYVDTLSPTQTEATDRRDLIHCINRKDFVDECTLL